jgi:choline-sulfatase
MEAYIRDISHRFEAGDFTVVAPSPLPPDDHPDGYIGRRAADIIERCDRGKPMFACVSFPGPHSPFDAPGAYGGMFDPDEMELAPNVGESARGYDRDHIRRAQANYCGKLAHLDDRVGELAEALRRRGTWDEALVVFAADHGEYMGSHGRFAKGSFHEESARVPLILRWPGRIPAGAPCDSLVELIDLYPTVVEAAGGEPSPHRFGVSLLPLATGQKAQVHDAVFSEIAHAEHFDYMVRGQPFKWFLQAGVEHLYDLRTDPYETRNLAQVPAMAPVLRTMRQRLARFLMTTQVNYSAGYRNLFTRIGLTGNRDQPGVARRLERMFREIQGL